MVGLGFHPEAGLPHAEVYALRAAGGNDPENEGQKTQSCHVGCAAEGSTAYVTLEPCSHYGRTPPCSQALLDAHVSKVVHI